MNDVLKAGGRLRPEVQPKYCLHFLALSERREEGTVPFALDTDSVLSPVHLSKIIKSEVKALLFCLCALISATSFITENKRLC